MHRPIAFAALAPVLIFVLIALGGSSAAAQSSAPAPVPAPVTAPVTAVARFAVDVDGMEVDYPGEAGGLLPRMLRAKDDVERAREAVDTIRNPEGSAVKTMLDSVYAVVVHHLVTDFGLQVLPLDTLRGDVMYVVGYPHGSAREVAPRHAFDRVADVDVDVTVPDAGQAHWSFFGTGSATVKGRPEMFVRLHLVDATGATVWTERVRVRSKEKVELNERYVLGVQTEQRRPDASSLPGLTAAAMQKLAAAYTRSL